MGVDAFDVVPDVPIAGMVTTVNIRIRNAGTTGANLVVDGGLTANLYIMETLPKG